jgi:hypothetical protein
MLVNFKPIAGVDREEVAFGCSDGKGRWVGAIIYRSLDDGQEDQCGYPGYEPGLYYTFRPMAARNGLPYGGGRQPHYHFKSEAEREAAIEKYLASAKKRALKQWGVL